MDGNDPAAVGAVFSLPLMGVFHHNVDGKNRLFIPSKHRDILGQSFIICPSIRDKSLKVYSLSEWNKYTAPIEKLDRKYQEVLKRFYNSSAAVVTPDSQGRVVLTPELVEYAGLESRAAVIVGCGNFSEIWSEENYSIQKSETNLDELLSVIESQGL